MKLTIILGSIFLSSFIMAAPLIVSSSISIIDITSPPMASVSELAVLDTMSGKTATASISIDGHKVSTQSSGAERIFAVSPIGTSFAIVSILFLI